MGLTLGPIMSDAGINPADAIAIRHAYTTSPDGIHADSTNDEILTYTALQSTSAQKFPAVPPKHWVVFSSVIGIYLITDISDGRHYVGKADGLENIHQRWSAYAANGHGGNVELRGLDPTKFRFSLLRVFDPSTPTAEINAAESHYKLALYSRVPYGLNRN